MRVTNMQSLPFISIIALIVSLIIFLYYLNMTFLFILVPSFFAYLLWSITKVKIKSNFIKIPLFAFLGQYLFAILAFLISIVLSSFTDNLLQKSSIIALILMVDFIVIFYKQTFKLLKTIKLSIRKPNFPSLLLATFCLFFAVTFFSPHLYEREGIIFRSPIYWDFHWHASLIQNITLGDNIPLQNEAFAGVPHAYHYFWAILVGIYTTNGLNLSDAINLYSILGFTCILLVLVGLSEEFFKTKAVGIIAIILSLTSSSLHFVNYFLEKSHQNLLKLILDIFTTQAHPWPSSFLPNKLFGYNGTMFNLFYFVEERQLIFGVLFMLLSFFIIYRRKDLSNISLLIVGALMGAFFLWHLQITLIILTSLLFLLIFDRNKKQTLSLLAGFLIIFIPHYLYFKFLTFSAWYDPKIKGFPKLNFGFADMEDKPFSTFHFVFWYVYSYGLKLIFFLLAIIVIFKKNRRLALGILSIVLPTFVILNTLQLTPATVYENHKFLRPMNFLIDIAAAFCIYFLFMKRNWILKIAGFLFIVLLSISGIIELMPFINSKPNVFYTYAPSQIHILLNKETKTSDVFIGPDGNQIQFAGRRLFLGDVLADGVGLNVQKRQEIVNAIYSTSEIEKFCNITRKYGIDFVGYKLNDKPNLPANFLKLPNLLTTNDYEEQVIFINAREGCK